MDDDWRFQNGPNKFDDKATIELTTEATSNGAETWMVVIFCVLAIVIITLISLAVYLLCRRKKRYSPSEDENTTDTTEGRSSRTSKMRKTDDMQAMHHDLQRKALVEQKVPIEDIIKLQAKRNPKLKIRSPK